MGDADGIRLLSELVAIAPTNLEDPLKGRWEKPNYLRAADRIVRAAREFGLRTRVFDPIVEGDDLSQLHGIPRPNVIIDLDSGAPQRILILAHYDVVPVPEEQLSRWRSPPHVLTGRSNGRLYGRGANDDLGSGVVPSLVAMKHLAQAKAPVYDVRLLVCCDEETGGAGGIEAMKAHDANLDPNDPNRILNGVEALIPDGSPHATAGSCGVAFLGGSFPKAVPLSEALAFAEFLVGLHETARLWRSHYPSPDWPDHGAPDPVITGRATVTRLDLSAASGTATEVQFLAAHAETDASNQIAESVSLVFRGPGPALEHLFRRLGDRVSPPFRLAREGRSALAVPPGTALFQLVGLGSHGGYPHRAHNPVPAALRLLRAAADAKIVGELSDVWASYEVDLRLLPEMSLVSGLDEVLEVFRRWSASQRSSAELIAPPDRCRGGYALPMEHPSALKLERLLQIEFGAGGVYGEYGGTDASTLADVKTPNGERIPALVFGSMDREAHPHEAEESVDPKALGAIVRTIERYVSEP